jgi:hypothetical protein
MAGTSMGFDLTQVKARTSATAKAKYGAIQVWTACPRLSRGSTPIHTEDTDQEQTKTEGTMMAASIQRREAGDCQDVVAMGDRIDLWLRWLRALRRLLL